MGKYDEVLRPFLAMMEKELHANAGKGDRPGWLQMDRKTAILEVFYHMGKLHQAVHRGEAEAIKEYAADVANMCMMLVDVCGLLPVDQQPAPVAVESELLQEFSDYARRFTFNSHPATPGMFPIGFPWFEAGYEIGLAKQPAPVAVVLPERMRHQSENPSSRISYIKGWNACLDKLNELNQ
jgi:hypothetical protein